MKNSRLFKLIQSCTKINKNRYISTIISHFFNNIVFFSLLFRVIQIIGQIMAIRIRSIMWFKNISLLYHNHCVCRKIMAISHSRTILM